MARQEVEIALRGIDIQQQMHRVPRQPGQDKDDADHHQHAQQRLQHHGRRDTDHMPYLCRHAPLGGQRARVTYSQLWNPMWPGIKGHSPTRGPTP